MSYQKEYEASIYLTFAGRPLILTADISTDETIFTVALPNFTLEELINGIIHMVKPSYTLDFDSPWREILGFTIPKINLLLKVPSEKSGKPTEFGIEYAEGFEPVSGFKIDKLTVFARSTRDVNFNLTGSLSFLGFDYDLENLFGEDGINLLDPQGMPKPEPKDSSLFKLNFLGVGQHLELQNGPDYNHVSEVVDKLAELMLPPPPGKVIPAFSTALNFNNNSQWLFAIDAEIMDTVAMKIAFNDPALYGLFLSLSGDKAKVFAGLEFEILYKKITDDLGVYQIEFKLPDAIRNIEMGAVSITLPIIGIWIYTNGNFKIDLGFPYNNDFSRSFTIQALPFTGAGGFYFAVLNGSTSLTVPQTKLGSFSPVLEFGIGMNLGLGKTFNKGILSAGLTIVFYGIIEGTLAWFNADKNLPTPEGTDLYYKLKGTFGIVGHIYGSVNFAIISATLDIMVYAQATIEMEAAEPILLAFEAGVSIELTVRISLGFFSINIHLSFSATVREQFTIGSPAAAQWKGNSGQLLSAFVLQDPQPMQFNWANRVDLPAAQPLDVYFIPFFSVSKTQTIQHAVGIASLFIENNDGQPVANYPIDSNSLNVNSRLQPFEKLCISILTWTFNAANGEKEDLFETLLTKDVTAQEIEEIIDVLNQTEDENKNLFSYSQLVDFIKSLFVLNIIEVPRDGTEPKTLPLTAFPIVPDLTLTDTAGTNIDFSTYNAVNDSYIQKVLELVSQFTDVVPETKEVSQNALKQSLATLLFKDYFVLLAKSLLQAAQENMEVYRYTLPATGDIKLSDLQTRFNVTASAIVSANKTTEGILATGQLIIIPGTAYIITGADTVDSLQKLHNYTDIGNWSLDFVNNNMDTLLFKGDNVIKIKDVAYTILATNTFRTIEKNNNLTVEELATVIENNKTTIELAALTQVNLPYFTIPIEKDATFLTIATNYNTDLNLLATTNRDQTILQSGAVLAISNVSSLTIQDILTIVYQTNGFAKAGGSASRFALHGLRLPQVTPEGNPSETIDGLYELSGQQIAMPHIDDPKSFQYTLTLTKPAPLNWLTFNGQGEEIASLAYDLSTEEIDRVNAFQNIDLQPKVEDGPKQIQLYKDQNRVFAFSNPISWTAFGKTPVPSIWNLPSSLLGIGNNNPIIDLKLAVQNSAQAAREVNPLPDGSYFYGTMVPISIKKINDGTNEKINRSTFEMYGTDAGGIALLTALLRTARVEEILQSVTILYASNPGNDEARALRSDDLSKLLLLLINTNLSTETNPEQLMFAMMDKNISNTTPLDFVARLWKSSLVRTGGYYLYYDLAGETLPDSLFDKNGNGEIYLLIQYQSLPNHQVTSYMNVAGVYPTINTAQTLLFGEWNTGFENATPAQLNQLLVKNQLVRNAVIKPGNIGFQLTRENPDEKFKPIDDHQANYAYEAEVQYNLLNYAIKGDGQHFNSLSSVAPVGPSKIGDDDKHWLYSKAMPISKFYNSEKALSAYVGLGESVSITFNWQDNYGNIFNTPLAEVNYKILYFDQLIPFSAWPSLTVDYLFFKPIAPAKENLALSLHFVPGQNYGFSPNDTDAQKAVVAQALESLKVYQNIQDQLLQTDVTIRVGVSLDPTTPYSVSSGGETLKNVVLDFVSKTIEWIQLFTNNPLKYNQFEAKKEDIFVNNQVFNIAVNPINPLDIFALDVNVTVSRLPELIDPQFIYDNDGTPVYAPGVQQITNTIKPKTATTAQQGDAAAADKSLGLRNFAQQFEETFGPSTFKLAATFVGEKNNNLTQTNSDELWVVKIKSPVDESGIACQVNYDQVNYYAPQPLANFLFSLPNTEIFSFEYYTGSESGSKEITFSEIDAEAWAVNYLKSIETILGSDLSLPITMIDHLNNSSTENGSLAKILKAKQTVAEAIGLQTIPILINQQQDKAGLDLATEKLRQQLLINLHNGYQINAVVQYQVDMKSPYPNSDQLISPNYYGKPFIKQDSSTTDLSNNYAFSTAKIPLEKLSGTAKPTSYLTYTFESKTPSLSANVKLPIQYKVTHAEFDIQKLNENADALPDDINDYEISSWLNFIIPFDAPSGAPTDTAIPIPLRQYPSLPTFASQLFDPNLKNNDATTDPIDEAKLSSFTFDYRLASFVAQDTYNFEVYFNADPKDADAMHDAKGISAKQKALFAQLAQFTAVDVDFANYLETNLPKVSKDISDDQLKMLTKVLNAYGELANQVSDAWLNLYTPDKMLMSATTLDVITASFNLIEHTADQENPTALFEMEIRDWSVTAGSKDINYVYFPEVKIGDWNHELYYYPAGSTTPILLPKAENPADHLPIVVRYFKNIKPNQKVYLKMDEAIGIQSRSVSFSNLSVLLVQNAWAGLWIERNSELSSQYLTAPEFIYATPLNRFSNPIMPSLNISNTIPLQPISSTENNLKDYLKNLLSKLLLAPDGSTASASLKILVQYKYTVSEKAGKMPFISLPVALMPPTLFTDDDINGAGKNIGILNDVILDWFNTAQPSLNNGQIVLSAYFYSNLTGTANSLPLLALSDLEIDVNMVKDIKSN